MISLEDLQYYKNKSIPLAERKERLNALCDGWSSRFLSEPTFRLSKDVINQLLKLTFCEELNIIKTDFLFREKTRLGTWLNSPMKIEKMILAHLLTVGPDHEQGYLRLFFAHEMTPENLQNKMQTLQFPRYLHAFLKEDKLGNLLKMLTNVFRLLENDHAATMAGELKTLSKQFKLSKPVEWDYKTQSLEELLGILSQAFQTAAMQEHQPRRKRANSLYALGSGVRLSQALCNKQASLSQLRLDPRTTVK